MFNVFPEMDRSEGQVGTNWQRWIALCQPTGTTIPTGSCIKQNRAFVNNARLEVRRSQSICLCDMWINPAMTVTISGHAGTDDDNVPINVTAPTNSLPKQSRPRRTRTSHLFFNNNNSVKSASKLVSRNLKWNSWWLNRLTPRALSGNENLSCNCRYDSSIRFRLHSIGRSILPGLRKFGSSK